MNIQERGSRRALDISQFRGVLKKRKPQTYLFQLIHLEVLVSDWK